MKLNDVGLTVAVEGLTTSSSIGTEMGLPVAPKEVMVTWPIYVPMGRFAPLAETETLAGVVPLVGVTESHVPPVGVSIEVVTLKLSADEPVTAMVCGPGWEPPTAWVNVSLVVGAEIVPDETVTVTFTVCVLPEEVTVMEPL